METVNSRNAMTRNDWPGLKKWMFVPEKRYFCKQYDKMQLQQTMLGAMRLGGFDRKSLRRKRGFLALNWMQTDPMFWFTCHCGWSNWWPRTIQHFWHSNVELSLILVALELCSKWFPSIRSIFHALQDPLQLDRSALNPRLSESGLTMGLHFAIRTYNFWLIHKSNFLKSARNRSSFLLSIV